MGTQKILFINFATCDVYHAWGNLEHGNYALSIVLDTLASKKLKVPHPGK